MSDNNNHDNTAKKVSNKYLIKAIRYHFTEYSLWMAFFITINGGLLVAYRSKGLKPLEKILILVLGYIVSILFRYSSEDFKSCIARISQSIEKFKGNDVPYSNSDGKTNNYYYEPLRHTKVSTTRIVSLFARVLMYAWGILLILNIYKYIDSCKRIEITLSCNKAVGVTVAIILIFGINLLFRYLVEKRPQLSLANRRASKRTMIFRWKVFYLISWVCVLWKKQQRKIKK